MTLVAARLAQPRAHADGRRHDREPRRRARPRRRRLPAEAVRLRRARRPHPRARTAQPAGATADARRAATSASTPAQRVASRAGRRLELSPKELAVLELLLAADGAPVSTERAARSGRWDEYADPFCNVVKVTISRLRRKLGDPPAIETVAQPATGSPVTGALRALSGRWLRAARADDPAAAHARSTAASSSPCGAALLASPTSSSRTSTPKANFFITTGSADRGRRNGRPASRGGAAVASRAGRSRRSRTPTQLSAAGACPVDAPR